MLTDVREIDQGLRHLYPITMLFLLAAHPTSSLDAPVRARAVSVKGSCSQLLARRPQIGFLHPSPSSSLEGSW